MSATSSERLHRVRALSRGSSHSLTRLLIASYFLASVMGIIRDPVLHTMLSAHGSSVALQLLLVSSVTITALMVMFAHFVRPAALFLAVFTLWSAVLHFGPGWSPDALGSLWLQLALTSALVLVATDAPAAGLGRRRSRSSRGKGQIAPRRIAVRPEAEGKHPARPAPVRLSPALPAAPPPRVEDAEVRTRPLSEALVVAEVPAGPAGDTPGRAVPPGPMPAPAPVPEAMDDAIFEEEENIFADLWDEPVRRRPAPPL